MCRPSTAAFSVRSAYLSGSTSRRENSSYTKAARPDRQGGGSARHAGQASDSPAASPLGNPTPQRSQQGGTIKAARRKQAPQN